MRPWPWLAVPTVPTTLQFTFRASSIARTQYTGRLHGRRPVKYLCLRSETQASTSGELSRKAACVYVQQTKLTERIVEHTTRKCTESVIEILYILIYVYIALSGIYTYNQKPLLYKISSSEIPVNLTSNIILLNRGFLQNHGNPPVHAIKHLTTQVIYNCILIYRRYKPYIKWSINFLYYLMNLIISISPFSIQYLSH